MAISRPTYTKLSNGMYRNDQTLQIIDPRGNTPDQLAYMGLPPDAGGVDGLAQAIPIPAGGRASQAGEALGPSRSAQTDQERLVDKIYGTTPTDYSGAYDTAYQNAGQPAGGPHGNKTIEGTQALADAFVNRFYEKTNALPSEDQVRQFVAQNLTPGFAAQTIAGTNKDSIVANYVDPYLKDNGIGTGAQSPADLQAQLQGQYDTVYDAAKKNYLADSEDQYGAQKANLTNDLSGQGLITQPNSRISLDALEAAKNKNITSGLNTLAINRATGQVDLAKTIQDLLQKQETINNNTSQFNKTFNAGREDTYFNQGLQNKQLGMAQTLGKLKADSSGKDWTDYLNTGLKVAGTAGQIAALF